MTVVVSAVATTLIESTSVGACQYPDERFNPALVRQAIGSGGLDLGQRTSRHRSSSIVQGDQIIHAAVRRHHSDPAF